MKWRDIEKSSKKLGSFKFIPNWLKSQGSVYEQVKSIRITLGMTQKQLSTRSGLKQPYIVRIEKNLGEAKLSTLEKLADALECELIINLVPKKEITKILETRSNVKAKEIIGFAVSNSKIENQKPQKKIIQGRVTALQDDLLKNKRTILWE